MSFVIVNAIVFGLLYEVAEWVGSSDPWTFAFVATVAANAAFIAASNYEERKQS